MPPEDNPDAPGEGTPAELYVRKGAQSEKDGDSLNAAANFSLAAGCYDFTRWPQKSYEYQDKAASLIEIHLGAPGTPDFTKEKLTLNAAYMRLLACSSAAKAMARAMGRNDADAASHWQENCRSQAELCKKHIITLRDTFHADIRQLQKAFMGKGTDYPLSALKGVFELDPLPTSTKRLKT